MVVSVLTLALIAYDRFFGIVFALKAHLTERKAKKSLIFVWTCAFAVACPMIVYRQVFSRHWANHVEIWCDDKWPVESYFDPALNHTVTASPSRKIYYTFVSVVLFFIPMAIMTIAYSVIICRLRGSAMPGERIEREVAIQAKIKRKVVIMLIVILVLFGVCWLPYMISILYPEYREVSSHQLGVWYFNLQFTALYLAHSNAALNPLIYVGLNENFRQGLKDTFRCMRARRSEEFILGRTYSVYNSTSVSRV